MNELMAKNALYAAGTLETTSPGLMVYTINGHSKTVAAAPLAKILRAVCKHHAVWLLNNLGKAVLGLTGKHGQPREHCGGELELTADDLICFKTVLSRLGSTVQLAERFVLIDGAHVNVQRKSTTLRIGDLLYIYHADENDDASTAIATLARQAALELIARIFERGEALKAKAKEADKKQQKKTKAVAATKKRRLAETSADKEIPLEQEDDAPLEVAE